jgi:hypothetical protein
MNLVSEQKNQRVRQAASRLPLRRKYERNRSREAPVNTIKHLQIIAEIFDKLLSTDVKSALAEELERLDGHHSGDDLKWEQTEDSALSILLQLDCLPAGLAERFSAEVCTLADSVTVVGIAKTAGLRTTELDRCVGDARRLSRHLFKSDAGLASLPVAIASLTQCFQKISPAEIGMTPKSFGAFRSRIFRLARVLDRRMPRVVLPKDWAALVADAKAAGMGHQVGRAYVFIRTAARLNLAPSEVDGLLVSTVFEEACSRQLDKPHAMTVRACQGWNALAGSVPGWPKVQLTAPDRPEGQPQTRVFFSDLPDAVQLLWQDFEDRHLRFEEAEGGSVSENSAADGNRFLLLLSNVLEDEMPRYSRTTLNEYRGVWLRLAHMALNEGVAVAEVGDVLSLDRCTRLLEHIEKDQIARASTKGEKHNQKNATLVGKTAAMIALARATHGDPDLIEALIRMRGAVNPMVERMKIDRETGKLKCLYSKSRRRTGPRHQRVIDQFSGDAADAVKSAFFQLPERLIAPVLPKVRAGVSLSRTEQVDVMVALTCRILMECPMRRANLAGSLRISGDRQTLFLPKAKGRPVRLHIPASETKTKKYDVVAEFSEETSVLLRFFTDVVRPQLAERVGAGAANPWLFPGEESSPRSAWSFSTTLKARAEKVAGIKLNPHAFRHVVGLLVLEEDPSQLPLVSTLLGHSSLRTTSDWYAEVPQKQAHQAYLAKLASVSAKVTRGSVNRRKRGK